MRTAVTGADGFLGWHTRAGLRARGIEFTGIGRDTFADPTQLDAAVRGTDVVLHLAGVNRHDDRIVHKQNLALARDLTAAMDRVGSCASIVYANSIRSGNGTPFGDGKGAAAEHLTCWGQARGAAVADVRLPNLFGEHGRAHYNSVVATFCHELAAGRQPQIRDDRELPLLHVQDAVDAMLGLGTDAYRGVVEPAGRAMLVSAVLALLTVFRDLYSVGDIPDIANPLNRALFNTYRSFTFPQQFPIHPPLRADARGRLFECVRGHGGQAQVFMSMSHPGVTRGEHFHLRKIERFVVLSGTAQIALRRLFDNTIVRFEVSAEQPAIVDMPTMWAHSITNTGDDQLLTLFWADELLDPAHPDTFPEPVGMTGQTRQ